MGRFTDDGWESARDTFSEEQCAWCGTTFTACWSRTVSNLARPLCGDCQDHLCTQCGDARAVGLDHQFAPMQMCQDCLDQAFEEASEALVASVGTCVHCGETEDLHYSVDARRGTPQTLTVRICPTSVWRAR